MPPTKSFLVFDTDSHIVEPKEVWEKYLDPEYRTLGKSALWREESPYGSFLQINGKKVADPFWSKIPRYAIWRPGTTRAQIGSLDPTATHVINPGAQDPEARLKDMDAMGVDQALLFPTWFAEGFPLVEDTLVAYALARAYNDWIADFCKAAPDRLFAAAMVPLQHMDFALQELRRVAKNPSFRAAFIRPVFMEGRYLNHPYYKPLWEELEKLDMTVAAHPTPGLYTPEMDSHGPWIEKMKAKVNNSDLQGGGGDSSYTPKELGYPVSQILSYWFDNSMFLTGMFLYGVLQDHPKIKMVMAHSKATWMHLILEKVETYTLTLRTHHQFPLRTDPEKMWDELHVMLNFDATELGVQRLPERYSAKSLWGSRYPQDDTMSAWEAIEILTKAGVADATIAQLMGGNAAEQYGVKARDKASSTNR